MGGDCKRRRRTLLTSAGREAPRRAVRRRGAA